MAEHTRDIPADWSRYRAYLRFLSDSAVPPELRAKLDPSDLVQQSLLQAYRALPAFAGTSEGEMLAWLRQILARNVARAARDFGRQRRDVLRERTVMKAVESSSIRLAALLEHQGASPPDQVMRAERVLHLCEAIEELPEAQREAVTLHHLEGLTIAEVADRMDRSAASIGGLLKRGLKALRHSIDRD
jgi:RNA polymerase sigma-70 factor (ECF subfamily)